jgi:hypothetical protein
MLYEDCRFHDLGNVYCGDLLKGKLFNVELYESHVSFI